MKKGSFLEFFTQTRVEKFLSSNIFLAIIAFIVILFWTLKLSVAGLVIILSLFALSLVLSRSTLYSMPLFLCMFLNFNPDFTSLSGNEWIISFAAIPIIGLILHCIVYRPKLRIRGFGVAMLATTVPWVLQGLGRRIEYTVTDYFSTSFVWVAYLILALLGLFFLFTYVLYDSTIPDHGVNMADYMNKQLLLIAVIVFVQCFITLVKRVQADGFDHMIRMFATGNKEVFRLGWGGPNNISAYLSLTIPATAYLAFKSRKCSFILYLFTYLQYYLILLTFSRGPMIFVTIGLPFIVVYCFVKGDKLNRLSHGAALTVALFLLFFVIFAHEEEFAGLLKIMFEDRGLDDNGRFEIYADAINVFKKYPIFGGGMDVYFSLVEDAPWSCEISNFRVGIPYWFHSTIAQIVASFGVLGIVTYLYQYIVRYSLAFKGRKKPVIVALGFSMFLFELYGFIDTNFFSPVMYLTVMLMTLAIEKEERYVYTNFEKTTRGGAVVIIDAPKKE